LPMSAFGPKRTSVFAPHMSVFGGKADIALMPQNIRLLPEANIASALLLPLYCHGAIARICIGLCIVVNRPGATCSDAVEADSR
jgi:hypothetical protein